MSKAYQPLYHSTLGSRVIKKHMLCQDMLRAGFESEDVLSSRLFTCVGAWLQDVLSQVGTGVWLQDMLGQG